MMTSTIRTSWGLALAMVLLGGCNTPTTVRHEAEPAPVIAIVPPVQPPVLIGDSARALPAQDPIGLRDGINPGQHAPGPDASAAPLGLAKSMGGHGTCRGKDPAAAARATQGISETNPTNPYVGKDTYVNVVFKKGVIFYSLTPGRPPGFAVTQHTLAGRGATS